MQTQKWAKEKEDCKEVIAVMVKEVAVKRENKKQIVQAIHRAQSNQVGMLSLSCPIVRDIQAAIRSGVRTSKSFGYTRISIDGREG